jgi:hypothetical protein
MPSSSTLSSSSSSSPTSWYSSRPSPSSKSSSGKSLSLRSSAPWRKPYQSLSGSLRRSQARKQTQKMSGLRREPTLNVWQTFWLFAGFCCIFPFVQIHFHAFLQMRLQGYTQGYPARCTDGSAASKEARSSGLRIKLEFWPTSEAQALASGAAVDDVEALACVERSSQQTSQPPSMWT